MEAATVPAPPGPALLLIFLPFCVPLQVRRCPIIRLSVVVRAMESHARVRGSIPATNSFFSSSRGASNQAPVWEGGTYKDLWESPLKHLWELPLGPQTYINKQRESNKAAPDIVLSRWRSGNTVSDGAESCLLVWSLQVFAGELLVGVLASRDMALPWHFP